LLTRAVLYRCTNVAWPDLEEFKHDGGARKLTAPDYKDDIALRVKR
jgi:hypothetical protein